MTTLIWSAASTPGLPSNAVVSALGLSTSFVVRAVMRVVLTGDGARECLGPLEDGLV